jgi:phosphoribosylglycinamide formyltransferase-1
VANPKKKILVGFSGGGRTLNNLAERMPDHLYEVAGCFTNKADCKGIHIAKEHHLETLVLDYTKDFSQIEQLLSDFCKKISIDFIVLAGFLKKMPILKGYEDRIINIHPSLLPKYGGPGMYGSNVHKKVIENKDKESGATVHFVNEIYDDGAIISQKRIKVLDNDNHETLAARVFEAECDLYPNAIDQLIQSKGE